MRKTTLRTVFPKSAQNNAENGFFKKVLKTSTQSRILKIEIFLKFFKNAQNNAENGFFKKCAKQR